MKKFFSKPGKPAGASPVTASVKAPAPGPTTSVDGDHKTTFGVVYANQLAAAEIAKETPDFAVGSMIVREKLETQASETPQTVIAMVKREKGFSSQTGDWEFFVLNGPDMKLNQRETAGNCAECHTQAKKTDWVFRTYLTP